MKKIALGWLLPLTYFAFACDSSEDVDGGTPDSGLRTDATARLDATVTPDGGARPDAETPDAQSPDADAPDVETPDADPTDTGTLEPVTVRSYLPNGVALPLQVVFQAPDGTVVSSTLARGIATELLPPGSMISVPDTRFTGKSAPASIYVLTNVQPGDVYDLSPSANTNDYLGEIEVSLPGYLQKANDDYYLDFGCGAYYVSDPNALFLESVFSGCTGNSTTTISVLATVRDANDNLIAYSVADEVTLVPGGTVSVTLGNWETTLVPVDLSLTNLSTTTFQLYADHTLVRRDALYGTQYDYQSLSAVTSHARSMGAADFGDGDTRFIELQRADGAYSDYFSRRAVAGTTSLDFTSDFLPYLNIPALVATNDETRPELQWAVPTGANADGTIVRLTTYDPYATWFIVVPPGSTSVRLPELPAELSFYEPNAATQYDTGLFMFEANLVPDYQLFRTIVVLAFLRDGIEGALRGLAPAGLEARMTGVQFYYFSVID